MSVQNLTYCGLLTGLLKCVGENLVAGTMMSKINVTLLASRFWVQWEVDNQRTSPPLKIYFGLGSRLAGLVQPINGQKQKGVQRILNLGEYGFLQYQLRVQIIKVLKLNWRGGEFYLIYYQQSLYLRRERLFPLNLTFRFRFFQWLQQSSSYYVYYRIEYLRRS